MLRLVLILSFLSVSVLDAQDTLRLRITATDRDTSFITNIYNYRRTLPDERNIELEIDRTLNAFYLQGYIHTYVKDTIHEKKTRIITLVTSNPARWGRISLSAGEDALLSKSGARFTTLQNKTFSFDALKSSIERLLTYYENNGYPFARVSLDSIKDENDKVTAEQMKLLMHWAAVNGFEHYEISNFAKPGFESKHNSSYWMTAPYLGLGPSAHSYNKTSRQWNVSNNQQYIKALKEGNLLFEKEELTTAQRYNEYVMTHLRTCNGINASDLKNLFGNTYFDYFNNEIKILLDAGGIEIKEGNYTLNNEGKLMADVISAELFWVEDGMSS